MPWVIAVVGLTTFGFSALHLRYVYRRDAQLKRLWAWRMRQFAQTVSLDSDTADVYRQIADDLDAGKWPDRKMRKRLTSKGASDV